MIQKLKNENDTEIKNLQKIYEKTIRENLKDIKLILQQFSSKNTLMISPYEEILFASYKNLSSKWLCKRKYLRTLFVKKAFSNFYPKKETELLLSIDAIINILDDLLDEKMNEKEKAFYIIEFLRIFSVYNQKQPSKYVQIIMGHYFNKLITLAIAENHYKNFIKKEIEIEKIEKYSIESYSIRSLDIDIFNEIIFINYNISDKMIKKIGKIGRIFRAVNIIKKDIEDIEYDKKNNMETIVSIMIEKREHDFYKYITNLLNYYSNEAKKIKLTKTTEKKFITPVNNFYEMIEKNKQEIINNLK